MVDTVDTATRMYLIMEDNNRVTHSVLDREDFVSNQSSLFDTYLTTSYRHETIYEFVHFKRYCITENQTRKTPNGIMDFFLQKVNFGRCPTPARPLDVRPPGIRPPCYFKEQLNKYIIETEKKRWRPARNVGET